MPNPSNAPPVSTNPIEHTRWVRSRLDALAQQARDEVTRIDEPRAQALLETSAEVLFGLSKAYADYEKKDEPAWR